MNSQERFGPEDQRDLVSYAQGEMDADRRLLFELRLSEEPELAEALEGIQHVDGGLIELAFRHRRRARGRRVLAMAAAALAVVTGLAYLTRLKEPETSEVRIALLESDASLAAYGTRLGLEGLIPPGHSLRGESSNIGADDYVRKARVLEGERADVALERETRQVEAGHFVLVLKNTRPTSLLVLSFPDVGTAEVLFPKKGADTPLPPGLHHLPGELVTIDRRDQEQAVVEYRPGFLLPLGCGRSRILVATSVDPPAGVLDEARERIAAEKALSLESTEAWLLGRGFQVSRLTVVEP